MKSSVLIVCGVIGLGCGTPPEPAAPAAKADPAPSATATTPAEPVEPSPSPSAEASAKPPEPEPDTSPREVKYVMASGKLEVIAEGVHFRPTAKAVRVGGGWGVQIDVEAEAEDDKMHSLLQPKSGALALAGKLTRKAGKIEALADTRDGEDEAFVTPGTITKLVAKWPSKAGDKPLGAGDKITLQVGLWGIGADAKSRRPLKKFLSLTMQVGKGEPRPLLAPPE